MKVKDLISLLERCPQNHSVFLSIDEEGNQFKSVMGIVQMPSMEFMTTPDGKKVKGVIIYPKG